MKKIFPALLLTAMLIPLILVEFFTWNILWCVLFFYIYEFMIAQYYVPCNHLIEMRDYLFTALFVLLCTLIYYLLSLTFSMDQIMLLLTLSLISTINTGCNHRFLKDKY